MFFFFKSNKIKTRFEWKAFFFRKDSSCDISISFLHRLGYNCEIWSNYLIHIGIAIKCEYYQRWFSRKIHIPHTQWTERQNDFQFDVSFIRFNFTRNRAKQKKVQVQDLFIYFFFVRMPITFNSFHSIPFHLHFETKTFYLRRREERKEQKKNAQKKILHNKRTTTRLRHGVCECECASKCAVATCLWFECEISIAIIITFGNFFFYWIVRIIANNRSNHGNTKPTFDMDSKNRFRLIHE